MQVFSTLRKCTAMLATASLFATSIGAYAQSGNSQRTSTPIEHVVVIFQENVSFDHYFATYPFAANLQGEPRFTALPGTPSVNGLTPELIARNPNSAAPFRFSRTHSATCDQDHSYGDEQKAFDAGLMDKFVETVGNDGQDNQEDCKRADVMGYFDGNTVTAIWNYAQHFAMSDNSFGTTFGPSAPGALNLVSGQTSGATPTDISGSTTQGAVIGDPQPSLDDCSNKGGGQSNQVQMSGKNVGDLLNANGVTWGWFQGGFRPTSTLNGKAVCGAAHIGSDGLSKGDYIPHHEPFQYYVSTANSHHLPPSSPDMIGETDQANHQYDLADFYTALTHHNLPAVTFLKAAGYQDGHAGYSDPLAEQTFLVDVINKLQNSPEWKSTAVIISYDDSDGWYDHQMGPIVQQSNTIADFLTGTNCGTAKLGEQQGRCGYGPRLPLLVVSSYAKQNFVDHTTTDQSSILKFIEDNWSLGRIGGGSFDEKAGSLINMFDFKHKAHRVFLDSNTGLVVGESESN